VFIRLSKWLPKSTEISQALRLDMQAERGEEQDLGDFMDISATEVEPTAIPEQTGSGGSKLDELAKANQAKAGKAKEQAPETTEGTTKDSLFGKGETKFSDKEEDPYKTGELKK
jgi:hypothetical protein